MHVTIIRIRRKQTPFPAEVDLPHQLQMHGLLECVGQQYNKCGEPLQSADADAGEAVDM